MQHYLSCSMLSTISHREFAPVSASGRRAGDPAHDGAPREAGAAGIVVIEQATHELTAGGQATNRHVFLVDDLTVVGDLDTTEGEGHPARHPERLEGRFVNSLSPVRLWQCQAD